MRIEISKKSAQITKVERKTILSAPRLVNEVDCELLAKPVPLDWIKTTIVKSIARTSWVVSNATFIKAIILDY